MLRILFLTQYFPPESGAPQQRIFSLAAHLCSFGMHCHVLTCHPHYPQMKLYSGYDNQTLKSEDFQGIKVLRVPVYIPRKKSFFQRLINYFSFTFQSIMHYKKLPAKHYNFIFCESPPLFLGLAALYLKKKLNAKLIFNVSDLWPESIAKLGINQNPVILWPLWKLEALLYKNSFLITGQTQGICNNIKTRFPEKKTYWLPNGADIDKWNPEAYNKIDCRKTYGFPSEKFIIGYAGVIGLAQGLQTLLDCAILMQKENVLFVMAGDGPELEKLKKYSVEKNISNVIFLGHLSPEHIPSFISSLDVSVVPLKRSDLFLGAIPSKIFENLTMKIPVLLAVDGEARDIFETQHNAVFFAEPENPSDWALKLDYMKNHPDDVKIKTENGQKLVMEKFNRKMIARNFYDMLISCSNQVF
ncbi:MAG: glycosyltransferase family 4 protein [Bacteroidia bacterium]|nr:glycosyltransferase family 4 protein [Bacteroidia bacterium]